MGSRVRLMKNCGWFSTLLYFSLFLFDDITSSDGTKRSARGWRCYISLVECRMISIFFFVAIMMIEHKYLNWLKWTASGRHKTVFVYWNCFQHFFHESHRTLQSKCCSSAFISKRFVNLAQWCSQFNRRNYHPKHRLWFTCNQNMMINNEELFRVKEASGTSWDDKAEKWQVRVR